jgi:ribonuclease R
MNNLKDKNKLEELCKHISKREELSSKAQRDSIKYKQAEYLQDKIGQVFDGIVTGVLERGLYVEIIENKCEGMIRMDSIVGKWNVDLENYLIMNQIGEKIQLGDPIKVIVSSIDLLKKQINFLKF